MMEADKIPLVSVCIQTYQHAQYIKECLDSVLSQETNFPFEIIIGEDDSTDGTRAICIEYANLYPEKIRLFLRSEKDKIYLEGEKTGRFNFIENLKAAKGKYIALLDGDDYWLTTHKLQKQFDFMEANPGCSLCFHRTYQALDGKQPRFRDAGISDTNAVFTIDHILKQTKTFTIHTSNCMFRQSHIDVIPSWFYETPFLDFPIYLHNAQYGAIGYIAEPLSVYRINKRGMWLSAKGPVNYYKMWRLYTIMIPNLKKEIADILLTRRFKIGQDLNWYYNSHLWEDNNWFLEQLRKKEFPGDEILLEESNKKPSLKDYVWNCYAYSKKIVRKVTKR